jgi:hypothetical protein
MVSAHLEWKFNFEQRPSEDEGERLYSRFWMLYFSIEAFNRVDEEPEL